MNTTLAYLENSNTLELPAVVKAAGVDCNGMGWVELHRTPFFPEGGGQAGDVGTIEWKDMRLVVDKTVMIDFCVRHLGRMQALPVEGQACVAKVDVEARWENTRLHSAGEVLCAALEQLLPDAPVVRANHRKNQASVSVRAQVPQDARSKLALHAEQIANSIVATDGPVRIIVTHDASVANKLCGFVPSVLKASDAIRIVRIHDSFARPCVGTHVTTLGQIGRIRVKSVSAKGDETKFSYELV